MRTAVSLGLVLLLFLTTISIMGRVGEAAPPCAGLSEAPLLRASGLARPAVLFPRHRVLSPAPPLIVVTPGNLGTAEIRVQRHDGERRLRTKERRVPWPDSWRLIDVGEILKVEVHSCGQSDLCLVQRAAPIPLSLKLRNRKEGVLELQRLGLPMEALLLAAKDPATGSTLPPALVRRAGFPFLGLWRDF